MSHLGAIGLVVLVYTSISLVSSIEDALNDVFDAKSTRPFFRRIADYVTLLVTTPILLFAAATVSAAARLDVIVFLRERSGSGRDRLRPRLPPLAVVGLAFFAMYVILPNVRVRPLSALLGAALAAVGWQVSLVLHVQLQMGVAKYNALYSVLGALPIFLVWTYVSWLVVLVGGEIASSHRTSRWCGSACAEGARIRR